MTNDQRTSFELSVMSRNDILNSIQETIEAEIEKAKAEVTKNVRAEGRAETIRKMLAAGLPADAIAAALGITVEECEAYRD
jgi:hypothetical protein